MKKALVQGTRIVQIEDEEFAVHTSLVWVDVPDDTTTQDTYENGQVVKFVPPVVPPPDPPGENVKKRIQQDRTLKALVKRMATKEGVPLGQLLNEIAAEAD